MSVHSDLRLEVCCDWSAPSTVRRALAERADVGWQVGDLMLVASELVSNAVRHSGGGADDIVEVQADFGRDFVRLEVCDPGSSGSRAALRDADEPFGGLGLRLVEQLARKWGSQRRADGRLVVWAEVELGTVQG